MAESTAYKGKSSKNIAKDAIKIPRLESLDVFRGLLIFLTIFIGDLSGPKDISQFFCIEINGSRFNLGDLIFSCFLLVMGMAVPYALEKRRQKGDSLLSVLFHVVLRTFALLVMGMLIFKYHFFNGGYLSQEWFGIIMVISLFLIWNESSNIKGCFFWSIKILGALLLSVLLWQYKWPESSNLLNECGMLGILGWSYLICSVIFLFVRFNLVLSLLVVALALLFYMSPVNQIPYWEYIGQFSNLKPIEGIYIVFALIGATTGVLFFCFDEKSCFFKSLFPILCGLILVSLAGAYWGTNHWSSLRQQITPSWLFLCNVVFFVSLTIFYWLIEVAGYKKFFSFLAYAGTASLTCYLIFYLCHCIQTLIGLFYPKVLYSGYFSLGRAFLFSMIVLLIACSLSKLKVKIKI